MFSSGNEKVDRIAMIDFSGNIVPPIWFKTITKETGKPYLLAMMILSDIVYWYRPVIERSEETGQIISIRKKFAADLLQRSYAQFVDQFGESKQVIKRALDYLEEQNLIRRELRTVNRSGVLYNNVMYIDINVDEIIRITYPDNMYPGIKNDNRVVSKVNTGYYQKEEEGSVVPDDTPCVENDTTNTKNSFTQNSSKNNDVSINPSTDNSDRSIDSSVSDIEADIRKKIGYDYIIKMNTRLEEKLDRGEIDLDVFGKRYVNTEDLNPYISFIANDIKRTNYSSIKVEGKTVFWKEYIEKLKNISFSKLDSVIKKFEDKSRTEDIRSKDAYLRALLYNMDSLIPETG